MSKRLSENVATAAKELKKSYRKSFALRSKQLFSSNTSPTLNNKKESILPSIVTPRCTPIQPIIEKPLQPMFRVDFMDLSEREKTFQEVPLVVHNLIMFLYNKLSQEIDFFQDQPLDNFSFQFSSSSDGGRIKSMFLEDIRAMSFAEMNKMGVSAVDAIKIKRIAQNEQRERFFELLNENKNVSNLDIVKQNELSRKFDSGKLPNLHEECDVKTGFLLLKKYLLDLPKPLLGVEICAKLEMALELKCNIDIEKFKQVVQEEFKLFVTNQERIECGRFQVFKEIILFLRFIAETFALSQEEKDSVYLCYVNAMMHDECFEQRFIPLIDYLFKQDKFTFEINDIYQYETERVVKKYSDVICPLYIIEINQDLSEEESVLGNLFLTSYRVIFIPDQMPTKSNKEYLSYCAECPICDVISVIVDERDTFQIIRIVCKDMKVLTFKSAILQEDIQSLIIDLQTSFTPMNETECIPIPLIPLQKNEEVIKTECERLKITEEVDPNGTYFPHLPIYEPRIYSQSEEHTAVIVYQTDNGCKLLRFPINNNVLVSESLMPQSLPIFPTGVSGTFLKCTLKPRDVIERGFRKVQELIAMTNQDVNFSVFSDKTEEFGGHVRDVLSVIQKGVKEMMSKNRIVVLLPIKIGEKNISIFSALIEIVLDRQYRTINGFLTLLQKEFLSFKFFGEPKNEYSIYFCLFLMVLQLIIHQNITSFEYDDKLIDLLFTSMFSKRFSEFTDFDVDYRNSFIRLVSFNLHEFVNPMYISKGKQTQIIIPDTPYILLFDRWINYTKKSYQLFKSSNQITSISNTKFSHFPRNDFIFDHFTSITSIDLTNNKLKEFPLELVRLHKLAEIKLGSNDIHFICNEVSRLVHLTYLSLENNFLTSLPNFSNIPLKYLDLSNNLFQRNSKFDLNDSLETFKGKEMIFYPSILSTIPLLTSLDFSRVNFDIKDIIANPPKALQELIISSCCLQFIPEEITTLNISRLDVSNNRISKMNYSFFSMTSLRELDISGNITKGSNALFKRMTSLTILTELHQTRIPTNPSLSPAPRSFSRGISVDNSELFDSKKQCSLQELERIVIIGSDLRKDVFQLLYKKLLKEGNCMPVGENSFLFESKEVKKSKDKRQIIIEEGRTDDIRKAVYKYFRSEFIVCKKEKLGSDIEEALDCISFINSKTTVHIVVACEIDGKIVKKYRDEFKMNVYLHKFSMEKKKCSSLLPKIIKEIDSGAGLAKEEIVSVVNEFNGLLIPQYCLPVTKFEEILNCLGINNLELMLIWLTKHNIVLTSKDQRQENEILLEDEDKLLVDLSLFENTKKLFQTNRSKKGFFVASIFENIGIKNDCINFILDILEQNNVLMKYTRKQAESIGLESYFDDMYRNCTDQSNTAEETSQVRNVNSIFSGGSNSSGKTIPPTTKDKIDLSNVLIYPFSSFSENYEKAIWPSSHHRNEVEIGRVYVLTKFNWKIAHLLITSVMLKYPVQSYWQSGVVVVVENPPNAKLYVMIAADEKRRAITVRIRFLVIEPTTPFFVANIQTSIKESINAILKKVGTQIDRIQVMCSDCLRNGDIFVTTERQVMESIERFQFHVKAGNHEHAINTICCALDMIIDSLPTNHQFKIDNFCMSTSVAQGSNSKIGLYDIINPIEVDGEVIKGNVIIKMADCDMGDCKVDEQSKGIDLFTKFVEEFLREFFFITFSKNEHIARVYGFNVTPLFVVMEYFNGGSLFHILHESNMQISWRNKLHMAYQIADGMEALHTNKVPLIHRDLKSPNVLIRLNENGSFKNCAISDFGQTVPVSGPRGDDVECPYWLAPEVIQGGVFTQKSDVYSFGIILWELKTQELPFNEFNFFSVIREKIVQGYRPSVGSEIKQINSLITDCWSADQNVRPTFTQIKKILAEMIKDEEDFVKSRLAK